MKYEVINVHHNYGNNFEGTRKAKLFQDGTFEYFPEPEYDKEGFEHLDEDDEEDLLWMWKS